MSETDDTDDLLLIPPDFFLVHSEPEPPYYHIVDSLIKQVSNLQDRIEGIECISDVSLVGSYLDHSQDIEGNTTMLSAKHASAKRYYSHNDLYQPSSTQSTPQKVHEKVRLNSLPNSPNINRFSPRKNSVKFSSPQRSSATGSVSKKPDREGSEILHEIDTFISNVKTIQRNHAVRNLQDDFDTIKRASGPSSFNKTAERNSNKQGYHQDVAGTFQELDKQSEKIVTDRSEEGGKEMSRSVVQENLDRVTAWQCGDNIGSVPDYGAGLRDQLYNINESKAHPINQRRFKPNYQSGSTTTDLNSTTTTLDKSSDSSESTQLTAYNKSRRQDDISKYDQAGPKMNEEFRDVFKRKDVEHFSSRGIDPCKEDQERNELLHSPLHDNALSILDMHKKLLESTNTSINEQNTHKKRGINTLSDTLGLLSLADIWGSGHITQSPSKVTQKLQEEKLRRQHCEQLIQDLQNKNLELQQKLAVAVKVDETKNKTLQQFKETLDKVSLRMEKLNEEKLTWEREMARLRNQHSVEIESANQKISYYEKEASKSLNLAHANQEKISTLEKRCTDLQFELQQIEAKFKDVQENYRKEFEKNKQLADIITQKEIELKENKTVLNNAREEVSHSRKAVEVCQAEFTTLKNECTRLQTELREDKNTILSLNEQKRKLLNDLQTYKNNEKTLKDALDQSKHKLENTKIELRNYYQGQLEIIVENKRKEMQNQLDQERQHSLEEIKRKELSMAKTAANHIKEISEKCALETKLLEQKHQEEVRLFQLQLSQSQKEIENLRNKLAHLPEKRAQIAKQLQKVMENQWNEALKMINDSPTPISKEVQTYENINTLPPKPFRSIAENDQHHHHHQQELRRENFESGSDYDETPVSSRGVKQSESEIQKYINMLLNRPPGNPVEPQESRNPQNQQRSTWNPGDLENPNRFDASRQSSRERKSGKPPWK